MRSSLEVILFTGPISIIDDAAQADRGASGELTVIWMERAPSVWSPSSDAPSTSSCGSRAGDR